MSEELIGAAALTCRYVVALVLLTAAIPKLVARQEFERAVRNYALLPLPLVRPVAAWLPRLELTCGLALLLGIAVAPVAMASGALLAVFALAVAVNLAGGRRIDCGCYSSVAPRRIGWGLVAGDLALAGMAATAALADPGVLAVFRLETPTTASSLSSEDGVAIGMLAAVLVLGHLVLSSWVGLRRETNALASTREEVAR